jgi:hypothetical protein
MTNFTSAYQPPSLHGGQPRISSNLEVPLPQKPRAGFSEWPQGVVKSKRAKSPEHLPPKTIASIQKAQIKAGVRLEDVQGAHQEPPPVTSAGSRAEPGWGEWIASWFNASQPPEVAETAAQPLDKLSARPTRAGILTPKIDMPPDLPVNSAENERVWVEVLQKLFEPGNVHVLPLPPFTSPFVRNVATSAPDGTLVTSEIRGKESLELNQDLTRDAVEEYVRSLGLRVVRLSSQTNFANVEYVESKDALIIAHSNIAVLRDTKELEEVFGSPKYVLQVWLDLTKKNGDHSRCYDLDLAFHVAMNAHGKPVALLHSDCLKNDRGLPDNVLTGNKFRQELAKLGFLVIDISKEDQLALATQSVSNPDEPGKLLLTRDRIPPSLVQELADAGVEAVPPNSGKLIGYNGKELPLFGLHCLTVNIRVPIEEEEPKDGL